MPAGGVMGRLAGAFRSPRGRFNLVSVLILLVVVVAAGLAAALLARTMVSAERINAKAATIAMSGRGINIATDSVIQLERTNRTAGSILSSASPLRGQLATINTTAKDIDGLAASINSTAGDINSTAGNINGSAAAINGTAGDINGSAKRINGSAKQINGSAKQINASAGPINQTAKGINARAAAILDVAKRIDVDARNINLTLDDTIAISQAIKGDTGNILGEANQANQTSSCIAARLGGDSGEDC